LDYGPGGINLNISWWIGMRGPEEGFWMFCPLPVARCHQNGFHLLAKEATLAEQAIAEICSMADWRAPEAPRP
jgi:hypothetical protein